jgi:hypothetical protein
MPPAHLGTDYGEPAAPRRQPDRGGVQEAVHHGVPVLAIVQEGVEASRHSRSSSTASAIPGRKVGSRRRSVTRGRDADGGPRAAAEQIALQLGLEGAKTLFVASCGCGKVVLVQEPAKLAASLERYVRGRRRWLGREGWAAAERSERALSVAILDVDA